MWMLCLPLGYGSPLGRIRIFFETGPEPDIVAGYPAGSGFSRITGRFLHGTKGLHVHITKSSVIILRPTFSLYSVYVILVKL